MAAGRLPIAWFDDIGRNDVALVGGKNASLGEMVQTLAAKGIKVPPGFATTADAYWRYLDANELRQQITGAARRLGGRARRRSPKPAQQIRTLILEGDWPAETADGIVEAYREALHARRQGRCRRRGALERHGRGPAGRELRRPAGDLPQHPRRGGAARRLPALLRLALHRPRHQLPQGQGLRPHEGRAVDRRAADGALRPRRRGRHVLDRHRDRLRQGRADQRRLGPGRERRAGRGRSRTSTRCSSRCSPIPALVPIVEKKLRREGA